MAAVINRAVLLMMNPFGIAYFVSAYIRGSSRLLLTAGTLAGMCSVLPVKIFLKYTGIIAGIIVIEKILKICRKKAEPWVMALICAFLRSNGRHSLYAWHEWLLYGKRTAGAARQCA